MHCLLGITNKSRRDVNYPSVFQLQTIELFLKFVVPSAYNELPQDLKVLLAKARKVSVAVDDYYQNSSRLHRKISKWFTRVGLHHRSEVMLGPFFLDMVVGEKLIVEIDGPAHFYRDTNSRTANSILKSLLLAAMGFRVRHLSYQEWAQCGTSEKRTLYCSTFWRDAIAADTGQDEDPERQLPLVDILEMVTASQTASPEAHRAKQLGPGGKDEDWEPSFYIEESLPGEMTGFDETRVEGHNVEAEIEGAKSVEELLAEHQRAELQMLGEQQRRPRGLRQRRRQRQRDSKTELPLEPGPQEHGTAEVADAGGAPARESQPRWPADLEDTTFVDSQKLLKAAVPRSKRRTVTHSRTAAVARDELEEETDSEDEGPLRPAPQSR